MTRDGRRAVVPRWFGAKSARVLGDYGSPQEPGLVFLHLVLARINESTSNQDSPRVLEEAGAAAASYPTQPFNLCG